MLKRTIFSALCATLLAIGVGYAQPSTTITLKSGQVITGQLIDLGGSGYTVRVNGQNQNISQNDVAVIDFTGGAMSSTDWANFHNTPQIVKRDGQTIDGQLTDIGGTSPLRLTVQTSSGTQELSSNDVSRIILARPANAPVATTGTAPASAAISPNGGTMTVEANQPWTPTGLTVQKGQRFTITATGTIQLSPNQNDSAGPAGSTTGRRATSAPLARMLAGELIAKIGDNGRPFPIGSSTTITMPASGQLFFGVNDDGFNDNTGSFQVTISRQ